MLAYSQATIFRAGGISSYDFHGEENTKTNKQEGAAYTHQQAKTDLCWPCEADGKGKYNLVWQP